MPMEDIAAYDRAMNIGSGIVLSMTLKAVLELDVLEIMAAAGPGSLLSPEEIASKIQTSNPHAHEVLDRMLRLLAGNKLVKCEEVVGEDGRKSKRRYGLGPLCKFFTNNEDGASLAPLILMNHTKTLTDSWLNLKYAVLDGSIPFVKTHGVTVFEHQDRDPDFHEIFNKAMFSQTTLLMTKMLENYKGFDNLNVLVDVGGGYGATLGIILSKYPHIKAINFDLPHVISQSKPIPGVEFVGGDMFESIPTGADAIFLKWILHNWSDAECVKILNNCWKALPSKGKIIVMERVIQESEHADEANIIFTVDLIMLTFHGKGKERTEQEYRFLAKESGFSGFKTVHVIYNFSVMEFYK